MHDTEHINEQDHLIDEEEEHEYDEHEEDQ